MPDHEKTNPSVDDPWLTLAEIAEELRLSPATIRTWIARGTIEATRAGQRKWLVRRSAIDQLLSDGTSGRRPAGARRRSDGISPPTSPTWSAQDAAAVDPADWLGVAESEWRSAINSTRQAPPDYWFPDRLKFLAATAARKAEALGMLDDDVRVFRDDDPLLDSESLSYELRPGSHRPGPPKLWVRFDEQVAGLRDAVRDGTAGPQRRALEAVSLTLHEIVDEIDRYRGRHGEWLTLDEDESSGDA